MTVSDIYAAINLAMALGYLMAVVWLSRRHWPTLRAKRYLRFAPPLVCLIYAFLGVAYGLVLFVPSERDFIGRSVLRPTLPLVQTAFFALVWLAVQEAEQLRAARQALRQSERARLREHERYLLLREGLVKEKEDFVAIALHEINTPLTLMEGYLSMLMASEDADEMRTAADAIHRTSGRFRAMKTLFDARLHRPYFTPFDVCSCAGLAIGDPWLYAGTRKQPGEIPIVFSCDGPQVVEADHEKIRVAIWELVRNALKATETDGQTAVARGIKNRPENGRVCIDVTADNGHVVILVEDNGVGIPPEYQPRIWDPGSQFYEEMTTRRNEGTGHGLYTVRKIMELHGGSVELDWSEVGKGSRFALYLPRR